MTAQDIIERAREHMNFAKFELDISTCTLDELVLMVNTPEEGSACRAFLNAPVAGSAFSQMYEHALHGGYVRCSNCIKVLVVFTERPPMRSGLYEYALLPIERVKHGKKPKAFKLKKPLKRPNPARFDNAYS
jgi:hypothetical protein